ncbi:DUF3087 domain-containing protein [Amphritea opalescens]|uniref:DUF3087 domain-containing protein n=1 Tax=Amphritea opalescens TaxID=2490544 RepID=A0A430KSJ8_9GAMM|nr:DUF3087 family protein [Amphritea opalescens]RTE66467.1 DUF3087 domain-containing protein [Amphritea opalescens]
MQLKEINKERYSKHYKQTMIAVAVVLAVVALVVSTLLIQLLGNGDGSNFWFNVAGVVCGGFVVLTLLRRYRGHEYMHEMVYVWDLKQILNKIYRKQKKIKAAAEEGDRDAMVIMNWSYSGSEQLYNLDNNTITMEDLHESMRELQQVMQKYGVSVSNDDFHPEMIDKY